MSEIACTICTYLNSSGSRYCAICDSELKIPYHDLLLEKEKLQRQLQEAEEKILYYRLMALGFAQRLDETQDIEQFALTLSEDKAKSEEKIKKASKVDPHVGLPQISTPVHCLYGHETGLQYICKGCKKPLCGICRAFGLGKSLVECPYCKHPFCDADDEKSPPPEPLTVLTKGKKKKKKKTKKKKKKKAKKEKRKT